MKVIIQIPCYNEEETLATTLGELPRELPGIDEVEWLVIDDGSTDRTVEVARANGVDHILSFPNNRGLARVFLAGLEASVKAGADIIVNTDADNQYRAADIPKLIEPILAGVAEMVIGERPISQTDHFSMSKKVLQRFGSWVVRKISGTNIPDAPSGFRAISRQAAMQLNVFNEYTYTLETIIQAGHKNIAITSVPISTNDDLRPSRLFRSMGAYIRRSIVTILRIFLIYRPARSFLILGSIPFVGGVGLMIRWLVIRLFFFEGVSRAPSLIVAAILVLVGMQLWTFGMIADLMATNRKLLEEIQFRVRHLSADPDAGKDVDLARSEVAPEYVEEG